MSKVKFGYLSRGSLPYVFDYQNVSFNGSQDNGSYVKLTCFVNKEKLTIPSDSGVKSCEIKEGFYMEPNPTFYNIGDYSYLEFESRKSKLDFTCKVDDNYIRTYKVNDILLFSCRNDPLNLMVYYENMTPAVKPWTFSDH